MWCHSECCPVLPPSRWAYSGGVARMVPVRGLAILVSAIFFSACVSTNPNPRVSTGSWSIGSNGGPVRAGEDVRIVLTYRPWSSRPVPNRLDFVALCPGCLGAVGPPEDRAIRGFLLLTPEQCSPESRSYPGPGSAICWSAPITFPHAGRWLFTTPFDVVLEVAPTTTR